MIVNILVVSDVLYSGAIPAYDPDTHESLQLYVGVIDILQSYRFAKKFEHTVKSLVHDAVSFTDLLSSYQTCVCV